MSSEIKTATINVNTIMLAVVLGVMSWVGYTAQQNSVTLAVIASKSATQDRDLLELRTRVAAVEISIAKFRQVP